jgi:hypothetical protein
MIEVLDILTQFNSDPLEQCGNESEGKGMLTTCGSSVHEPHETGFATSP